jgi:ribosomal protein L16 Arg81 hydroxylase
MQTMPAQNSAAEFSAAWEEWVADNLLRGIDSNKVKAVMLRNGFQEQFVTQKLAEITSDPVFRVGRKLYLSSRKLSTLFDALGAQYSQSRYAETFAKSQGMAPSEFYERYYFSNRPVVIQGLMADWEALRRWTPDYFAREFGECEVEITRDRSSDPRYEDNFAAHRASIQMKEYVHMVEEGGDTNDYYLVAKNYLLERSEFEPLLGHFKCPAGFLDPDQVRGHVKLWFGPKGTITPLHHDACNILFGQIYGRKRIRLISPFDMGRVYNDRDCYSAVTLDRVDYVRFPLMRDLAIIDVTVEPGEFILLPLGWWHHVESLDVSISLSFTNFCVDEHTVVWSF